MFSLQLYISKETSWDFPKTSELEILIFVWNSNFEYFPKHESYIFLFKVSIFWYASLGTYNLKIFFKFDDLIKIANMLNVWELLTNAQNAQTFGVKNVSDHFDLNWVCKICFRHFDFSDVALTFPIYLYIVSSENSIPTQILSGTCFPSANGRWTLVSAKKTS